MPDLATLEARLAEAETARHQLVTGSREVTVTVYGFGATTYTQANLRDLDTYISDLRGQIARLKGGARRGPLLIKF